MVDAVIAAYREMPADRPRELEQFVELQLDGLASANRLRGKAPEVRTWPLVSPRIARRRWNVPRIGTSGDLARRLQLTVGDLEWFADTRSLERLDGRDERLRHYRYTWIARPGRHARLIERPKPRLKALQRRVLRELLDPIPAADSAHGFRKGHSALTHAQCHVGKEVVLQFDLEDFFGSVDVSRVFGIFRTAGYPESVAHALAGMCTNVPPHAVRHAPPWPTDHQLVKEHVRRRQRLAAPHLPQGAPTSPALANLAALRLDRRLGQLATDIGATYSRYADDIAISGGKWLLANAAGIRTTVEDIVRNEAFRLSKRKTRLVTRAGCQRVTGIVVNERLNIPRPEYDKLKAVLHDAQINGPAVANRAEIPAFREHLLGRISWVESVNPRKGAKLRLRFSMVEWNSSPD